MKYLLALDAGTGSIRAVLFTADGKCVGAAARNWDHLPEPGVPGSMSFTTDQNARLLFEVIREVIGSKGISGDSIVGISAAAMREGFVLLDSAGREIWACANVDSRADTEVVDLQDRDGLLEEVYARSGQTFALAAQPRLLWLRRNRPEIYDAAATLVMLSEWLLVRLGADPAMEPSNGSTSGLLALATRKCDAELASLCGLRDDLVPEVAEPGTVIGTVSVQAAEETGLNVGTPLVVGGGDAQMAALGLGQVKPHEIMLTGGTFWQLNVNIAAPSLHPEMNLRVNAAAIPGLWQAEAIAFHPGTAVRWFRDTFATAEAERAKREGKNPLDVLTQEASSIPVGSDGVIPIFSDVMHYRNWTHAAPSFLNLSLEGGPRLRASMFRSLLENAAIVSAANLDQVREFVPVADATPVVFAGGAANSDLWCQIVADVMGRKVRVPAVVEATAQGVAVCAAVGVGLLETVDAAADWVTWRREFIPDVQKHQQYQEVRSKWERAYRAQLELMRSGVTEPLWHAPGS